MQYYLAPENRSKACLLCDTAVWASEAYNIRAKKSNIIGINISHERLFYNYGIDLDPKNYFKLMIEVIDYLRINYEIELYTNGSEPDNKMAHKIQNYYKTNDHNIRLIIPTTGPELVETISRYKAILATRLHSYIVAYSLNVLAVGMVWNRKVAFFGRNIQSDYMVESENFNKDYLVAMIKGVIKNGYNQHVRYEFRNSIIKAIKQFSGTKKIINMKYGLIVTPPAADQTCKNIGDYVQTVAAMQYYPRIDYYIPREYVSDYQDVEGESTKVVLNSWWMWHPENWPPHDSIQPLPISMHISPLCADKMLSGSGYEWFKRHEPIGCRDLSTLQTLQNRGIKSYFSSCLTLTLYKLYPPVENIVRSGICFVDPYLPNSAGLLFNLEMLCYCLFHPFTVFKLSEKHYFNIAQSYNGLVQKSRINRMRSLRFAAYFHKIYSTLFSDDVLLNADYIHHIYDVSKPENKEDKKLINLAVQLVEKYRTQRFVVTSRIHCALPCLAMETPVIFVKHPDIVGAIWNNGRLGGLTDFFRCVTVSDKGISTEDDVLRVKSRIDKNYSFQNKNNWRSFAKDLQKNVENFFKQ